MHITKIFFIVVTIALVAENLSEAMFSSSGSDSQNLPISSISINENHLVSETQELSAAISQRDFAIICAKRFFGNDTLLNKAKKMLFFSP